MAFNDVGILRSPFLGTIILAAIGDCQQLVDTSRVATGTKYFNGHQLMPSVLNHRHLSVREFRMHAVVFDLVM